MAAFTNGMAALLKFMTAFAGGSPAMMNGAIHNLINTLNQLVLLLGWEELPHPAGRERADGGLRKSALLDLRSAAGLFAVGAFLGLSYAWLAWYQLVRADNPALVEVLGVFFDPLGLALLVLGVAFIFESYALLVVLRSLRSAMRRERFSSPFRYLSDGADSALAAAALEGAVALLGLALAAAGIALSAVTGSLLWDVGGAVLIAVMLGGMAFYLMRSA